MFCSKCGARLSDGARFCASCGAPVVLRSRQESAADSRNKGSASQNSAPKSASERIKKPSTVAHTTKRKKLSLVVLAVGVLLCLVILAVAIWNPFTRRETTWSRYGTVGDLSEVSWYLQQVYQINDLTTCQFYDYFDMMEANYLLVRLPSETENARDGKFLIFGYDMSWCDAGGKCYEASPAVEASRKQIGTTDSGATILQVNFVTYLDDIQQNTDIIIAQNEDSQIESLLTAYVLNEYHYDQAGKVEEILISEANTSSWNTMDNFADCYQTGNMTQRYDIGFIYNDDGSLSETTQLLDAESRPWQIFTYEDGQRVRVEDTGCMPSVPCEVSFSRDKAGRVCAYDVEAEKGEPVNRYVQFSYQLDGTVDEGLSTYGGNLFGGAIRVDNFSAYYNGAPTAQRVVICNKLYNAVIESGVDENMIPADGAMIRADTVMSEYDPGTDVHYGSFIVDIAEIEHSYRVEFEWSSDPTNPHLSGDTVLVTYTENE